MEYVKFWVFKGKSVYRILLFPVKMVKSEPNAYMWAEGFCCGLGKGFTFSDDAYVKEHMLQEGVKLIGKGEEWLYEVFPWGA